MQSNDRDHFFETDATAAQRARRAAKSGNKHGNPIELKSKLLAAIPDPGYPSSGIFVAESAGFVRRVSVAQSSEPLSTYRGPKAPVTCLAIGGQGNKTIFAGCWDKDIWSWHIDTASSGRKYSGHSDFVKAVVCANISGKQVLISGGADKKILVWDVETGRRLHTLQDPATNMLAVQYLAIDPVLTSPDAVVFASAGSEPFIRRWMVTLESFEQIAESFHDKPDAERPNIEEHDTSVYKLVFEDTSEESDLWTASADGTSKCLSRSRNFVADESFEHGDYVRAVAVTDAWVITAGRDENVKVWDRSSGKLYATLEGHYEEVTDLVLLKDESGIAKRVCSVGIDRTVRTWPLTKGELDEAVEKMKGEVKKEEEEEKGEGLLTAEEEAELAELMDD